MKRLSLIILIFSLSAFLGKAQSNTSSGQPNIVFILTDDVGFGDLKAYNPESKLATPTLNRLAEEGIMFTNAHSPAALCAPTRYSVLTGNYPWRGRRPSGTWDFHFPAQIKPDQKTIGNFLKEQGYTTAIFGKMGIGGGLHASLPDGSPDFTKPMVEGPITWGFDFSYVIPLGHQQAPLMFMKNEVPEIGAENLIRIEGQKPFAGLSEPGWRPENVGERLLDATDEFLDLVVEKENKTGNNEPFLIYFCTDGAHAPYAPADEIRGTKVKGATGMGNFTDMVYETEVLTTEIIESLKKRGMLENTIIIYTSDNGGKPSERHLGHDAVGGLRGMKTTIFEGGTRVPLIAWWPGRIAPGQKSDQLIGLQDLTPTLVELAGGTIPVDQCLDGVSFAQWLTGIRSLDEPARRYLITDGIEGGNPSVSFADGGVKGGKHFDKIDPGEMFRYNNEHRDEFMKLAGESQGIVRAFYDGKFKLVFNVVGAGEPVLLYDLENDPIEEHNLIDDLRYKQRVRLMTEAYFRIRNSERSTF